METSTPPISKWFVWTSEERHFVKTYEEAWTLCAKIYKNTGRTAIVEPVYQL